VGLTFYYPQYPKPNKRNAAGLPASLFGLHDLGDDLGKPVLLCEGPLDCLALSGALTDDERDSHCLLAMPGTFKPAWSRFFKGRQVYTLMDNDEAGVKHNQKIAEALRGEVSELHVLEWPNGFEDTNDLNDLTVKYPGHDVLGWLQANSIEV
jgi:hypothetical protein